MKWLILTTALMATVIGGLSEADVILVNQTGLRVARIEIGGRKLESSRSVDDKIMVSVTPERHHLKVVFVGGADVDWPHFDFRNVHEIFFLRNRNKIEIRFE